MAVVTLEIIGLLLEVLGEVSPETTALLQDPLTWKLTSSHSLLRAQVLCIALSCDLLSNFKCMPSALSASYMLELSSELFPSSSALPHNHPCLLQYASHPPIVNFRGGHLRFV